MHVVDLTATIAGPGNEGSASKLQELTIEQGTTRYTGMVYQFDHDSMVGTYIDFPGHIKETDDGQDAATYAVDDLFRVDTAVIHLDRDDDSGAVVAAELEEACADQVANGALIVNALGARRYDAIRFRSVWLADDAIDWIVRTGTHLLISDIYESPGLHGVFYRLFEAGISTVCYPVNLDQVTAASVKTTVLFPRFSGVTQVPCRAIAEW